MSLSVWYDKLLPDSRHLFLDDILSRALAMPYCRGGETGNNQTLSAPALRSKLEAQWANLESGGGRPAELTASLLPGLTCGCARQSGGWQLLSGLEEGRRALPTEEADDGNTA